MDQVRPALGIDPRRYGTTTTAHGPACGHPRLNKVDLTDTTGPANDSYATRHNPFMYFRSIIDRRAYCAAHVVSLAPFAASLKRLPSPGRRRTGAAALSW